VSGEWQLDHEHHNPAESSFVRRAIWKHQRIYEPIEYIIVDNVILDMGVVEAACPHCSQATNGTKRAGRKLVGVHKEYNGSNSSIDYSENTYQEYDE